MKFKATEEQINQIAANAVNASSPMGMGYLQFDQGKVYGSSDFNHPYDETRPRFSLDYVDGRMVKLHLARVADGIWSTSDREPTSDYQSWCRKYPTYRALVESVGAEVIE